MRVYAAGIGTFSKQPLAGAEHNRVGHESQFIDQIMFEQVWTRFPLPITCISEPSDFLRLLMSSTQLRKTEFFQSDVVNVVLTQYFVTSMMPGHMSACVGQYAAKISNVFLPRRRSVGFSHLCINASASSSAS